MNHQPLNADNPLIDRTTGIVIVDHGSRRAASNDMLLEIVQQFRSQLGLTNVHAAHMELAEPTVQQAFDACVVAGAQRVVIHPYFLLPGRHWDRDIPDLARRAASHHPGVTFLVTAPLGQHPLMHQVMWARIAECVRHAEGERPACGLCQATEKCRFEATEA